MQTAHPGGREWQACAPRAKLTPALTPADDLGEAWARGVAARGGRVVRVTYPRTANNDKELSVVRGEYLEVSPPASALGEAAMREVCL